MRHLDNPKYLWGPGASEEHQAQSEEGKVKHIRQSRPDSGAYKTVTVRFWYIQESHGQMLVHIRQSKPDSGTYKTVKARFWYI